VAKFFSKSRVCEKFQMEVPLIFEVPEFPYAKNERDPSSRFDTVPTCDGQTDGHGDMPNTTLA